MAKVLPILPFLLVALFVAVPVLGDPPRNESRKP